MRFTEYLQTQPLLRVGLALAAGIVVGDKVACAWTGMWLAAAAGSLVAELLAKGRVYLQSGLILLTAFFAGAGLITQTKNDIPNPFPEDRALSYEAVLVGEPQVKGKVLRCDLALTNVNNRALPHPILVKGAILRDTLTDNYRLLHLGSGIQATSVMQPLSNFREGSNFDYVRWLQCHGFRAQTFTFYTQWQPAKISPDALPYLDRLKINALKLRQRLLNRLSDLPHDASPQTDSQQHSNNAVDDKNDQAAAVVAAMVLGDKHAIDSTTKDEYTISGASHILALSGLHLGIIFTILTLLLGSGIHRRWLSQAVINLTIWTYAVVVGLGTSVVRSALMLTIYSLCLVAGRRKASVNALAFAAVVIIVGNPLFLWDVGFQMSFMAVLAIVVFYQPLYRLLPKGGELTTLSLANKLLKTIWGTAAVSLSAQIGTAPLVAYYFERFSCYFLLTNYIVIPCATIIIYLAIAVAATAWWTAASSLLTTVLGAVATFLNISVSRLAALPGASIEDIHLSTLQLACIYMAIAIISMAITIYSGVVKMNSRMT